MRKTTVCTAIVLCSGMFLNSAYAQVCEPCLLILDEETINKDNYWTKGLSNLECGSSYDEGSIINEPDKDKGKHRCDKSGSEY